MSSYEKTWLAVFDALLPFTSKPGEATAMTDAVMKAISVLPLVTRPARKDPKK